MSAPAPVVVEFKNEPGDISYRHTHAVYLHINGKPVAGFTVEAASRLRDNIDHCIREAAKASGQVLADILSNPHP